MLKIEDFGITKWFKYSKNYKNYYKYYFLIRCVNFYGFENGLIVGFKLFMKNNIKNIAIKLKLCEDLQNKILNNHVYRPTKRLLKPFKMNKEIYEQRKKERNEKNVKTCLERYGTVNGGCSEQALQKIKETSLKNYGVENVAQSEEIIKKIKETKLKNHGNPSFVNPEKMKQTKLERYGDSGFVNPEKYKETCRERYGVDNYSKSLECKEKIINTTLFRYDRTSTNQIHLENFENLNEDYVKQNFIKDSRFLIDEFEEYFNILTRNTSLKYKKIYNILEPNKSNKCKTQQYIFDSINTENKIFNDRHLGKELDIFLPEYNLAIEFDGLMYHSDGNSECKIFKNKEKNYHLQKTELCLKNNIQLFHIFEGEDLDLWLSMINTKLNLNKKIYARKCIIKELKSQETVEFLNENHLQGFCQAKINVGLFYNNELVSVMTFSKPRFNKNYEYELIRFCSKRNTSVIGGASKLWKYFVTKYNPKSVISYANRRFSNGEIYSKLGFELIGKTEPNYFYFKEGDQELYSRVKFQKHKLSKLLDNFDENLSEAENMFNNNYRRIYDCGNLKFEYIKN